MTKVILYNEEIELKDELENGEKELDLFDKDINLEDTIELKIIKEDDNYE